MNKNIQKLSIYRLFKKSKKYSIKWSSYFQVYEKIFSKYRNKKIKFVEIGVANGGSLFMWKKYFGKKAKIIGIDLNPKVKKLEKMALKFILVIKVIKNFGIIFIKKKERLISF